MPVRAEGEGFYNYDKLLVAKHIPCYKNFYILTGSHKRLNGSTCTPRMLNAT